MTSNTNELEFTSIQWAAVELTEDQYGPMHDFVRDVMKLRLIVDVPGFALFSTTNGNIFELYGKGGMAAPWRNGKDGSSVGFLTNNIHAAAEQLKSAGYTPLDATADKATLDSYNIVCQDGIYTLPVSPATGKAYYFMFFRGPDGRIYDISQR